MLGRPVKLVMSRPQTFTGYGGRAATRQTVTLGADRDGKIQSIVHRGVNETSIDGMWVEPLGSVTSDHVRDAEFLLEAECRAGEYGGAGRDARAGREPERLRHRKRHRRTRL